MSRKPTLLCVDDDVQCLQVRKIMLEAFGFKVTTTSDPRQALRIHSMQSFDAAVLDFQMPHLNGAELAKSMKMARPDVPVVILSGLPDLPEDAPQYHDRFFCKAESGIKVAQEILSLIETHSGHGGRRVPATKRMMAAAGILFGFATQGLTEIRHRIFHGPLIARGMPAA
ncbi:MAG TPA: response regulator [Terriglobales bacterium]|nr:response regulator [Terriglobales bacterium]